VIGREALTLAEGTRLGRYEIRAKLGAGGMGEVYLAQDTSELARTVALKIVPAEVAKDKDRLQRFTQERKSLWGPLQHLVDSASAVFQTLTRR
jgi:serine/threonine protein kinase